ncbi:TrkH family potassium uptake protein [Cryomorpha ignava]|uniref:TrkH family potassium uptake protein n=1 Tax=Cryomorpha ignava TaxID=101383 RepID=A0A7K3WUM3_9FLAO|nr:TrkH family potassium uptake protein [Cryomorpha ignava]NEN24365.1 TrkH family potassium uptake protein [Cryomorpha ignava]
MKINFIGIVNILSVLLFVNSALMALCIPFSIYYLDGMLTSWIYSVVLSAVLGLVLWLSTYKHKDRQNIRKRDGYIIVTFSWFVMALSGAIPYIITGSIPNFTNAFFESISGFTTTGASILENIEELPESILFWRSLTQWIGGLGFIVLVISILPLLGIGGLQLFMAEAPGITADKLKPRIQDTGKRLWFLYIILTLAETILLLFGDMTFFDAINHSLTTMSTGGFSTKQASIAFYNSSYIEYVITAFMFMGGTSFVLLYLTFKGKFKNLFQNGEFRAYLFITLGATALVTSVLIYRSAMPFSIAFRESLFQVVSVLTTTGYASSDFTEWGGSVSLIFFILMFIGACAGSTAGGVKIVRHLIIAKNSIIEFRRQLHPTAIIPVRINGKAIPHEVVRSTMAFVIIYITIFGVASVVLALMGMDAVTAMGSVATSLGNIGPGLNETGPSHSFAQIPSAAKWILSVVMIIGRLELFTVIIIFTRYFWRST